MKVRKSNPTPQSTVGKLHINVRLSIVKKLNILLKYHKSIVESYEIDQFYFSTDTYQKVEYKRRKCLDIVMDNITFLGINIT